MKLKLLILFVGISIVSNAKLARPYRVFSEKGKYFIKSIPFSDQAWTKDGKTCIYQTKDSTHAITTINRYFQPDLLFLSNDGKSFCFLLNRFDAGNEWKNDVIHFYSNGLLIKKYKGDEFVDSTLRVHSLCYHNDNIDSLVVSKGRLINAGFKIGTDSFSAYLNTNSLFLKNDILYLLSHNRFVNRFDLKTGALIDRIKFDDYKRGKLIYPRKRIVQDYSIKIPTQFGLPKLFTGEDFCNALAKGLNMVYCDGENADYKKVYKKYRFEIYCGIDSAGNCVDLKIDCKDSLLRNGTERFLKTARFDKTQIPNDIERWYFRHIAAFRKESKDLAKKERELEIIEEKHQYQKRIIADLIDGVYIPADITDCFTRLNSMLKPIDIDEFKRSSEREALGKSHFGLGLWMRNNWGLWAGSRLSIYFNNLGIKHPDDMSGIILTSYHRFLNNEDIDLNGQISCYQK